MVWDWWSLMCVVRGVECGVWCGVWCAVCGAHSATTNNCYIFLVSSFFPTIEMALFYRCCLSLAIDSYIMLLCIILRTSPLKSSIVSSH